MTPEFPGGPAGPRLMQNLALLSAGNRTLRRWQNRYGSAFPIWVPRHGRCVVLSDPAEIKELFTASTEIVDNADGNLAPVVGSGSMFAMTDQDHRRRHTPLPPPPHHRQRWCYEDIVAAETIRELATWPCGRPVAALDSMRRITLAVTSRAVFGVDGVEHARLRRLLPRMITLGSIVAATSIPKALLGCHRSTLRGCRQEYDTIIDLMIARRECDQHLADRDDMLSMLVLAQHDDGTRLSRRDIADQLLALVAAGTETAATTLAWTIERVRRHPGLLRRLVREVDEGGSRLRAATLLEAQRARPVIDLTSRHVHAESLGLGRWTFARGQNIVVSIRLLHENEALFPYPRTFDPGRFLGPRADTRDWLPFGGGSRHHIGAAFAAVEMDVVLRTLLRNYTLVPTDEPDEDTCVRGVVLAPARKAIAVVCRRDDAARRIAVGSGAATA